MPPTDGGIVGAGGGGARFDPKSSQFGEKDKKDEKAKKKNLCSD